MPELPEVETVRRGLAPVLGGARLVHVEARRPDLRFPLPEGFVQRLTGARIERLERRAKYLQAPLDRGDTLVMHLGMSGRFEVAGGGRDSRPGDFALAQPPDPRHAHIVFETDAGVVVTYYDPRRFGYMDLIATDQLDQHPWFRDLGPEPLGAAFDAACLARAFTGKKQSVKASLLDQRIVAGLGNIYVCEALFRAAIAPERPAGDVSRRKLGALVAAIHAVLEEAIAAGGSTLRDYANADGGLGYFQHRFQVYGREGEACLKPGCRGHVERIVQSGRSTFACDRCQA
ncbi:MAG TPA: bifunctional DNA-formamidopyrimidine glycosylase/DNA-(apurinic or apyrimidinic site) lyase [Caulobacteraceae bacterium]|jgi:formamidopyrimidine-DNA glycosylase|nr:bifunctional DNA-formamidopyrimidine glycosylase/DNA-(apurinic or apyrimidinic site) lyase [Caulobacteraceae bacterium]